MSAWAESDDEWEPDEDLVAEEQCDLDPLKSPFPFV